MNLATLSSPNLGAVMGPDFARLAANLGQNLMESRLGTLTAVFKAASIKADPRTDLESDR